MKSLREYGEKPFRVAVIHGGPGAPGEVAPVARELSQICGVLEPFQSADSIDGQIEELKGILLEKTDSPITLVGYSWGAWLSYIFAVRYPKLIKKLILVGCGSFEEEYLTSMNADRTSRLTEEENRRVGEIMSLLNGPNNENRKEVFKEFGKLMSKADSFAPISLEGDILDFQPEVFEKCMSEIRPLRKNKELLNMGKDIQCPVVAIHGEYDSHNFQGVEKPLSKVIKDFRFILLKDCGHSPWNEVYAKKEFYTILNQEISSI